MTTKYCPVCDRPRKTKAIPFDPFEDYAKSNKRNWKFERNANKHGIEELKINGFLRKVQCLHCLCEWTTIEMPLGTKEILVKKIIEINDLLILNQKEKEIADNKHKIQISDLEQVYQEHLDKLQKTLEERDVTIAHLKQGMEVIHNCSKPMKEKEVA